MSESLADPFESLIRQAGQSYLVDWYSPTDNGLDVLRRLVKSADERGRERLGGSAPDLTPEGLIREYQRNPQKVTAFLQILGSASPDMLVMAWRILQGVAVHTLHVDHKSHSHFRMRIELAPPSGAGSEIYESDNIDDAVVLRHLGTLKMNDRPIFDGFYTLHV